MMTRKLSKERIEKLHCREEQRFLDGHRRSIELGQASSPHFLFGLPMHWMRDWPAPAPLFVQQASGNRLICADGHEYLDFCLGDTAAMFGHSPPAVARALAEQSARGLSAMLPGQMLPRVGAALAATFDLPRWQLALSASDANRFVLRWARAITGRTKVLVFDGCYHGTVDDTLVDLTKDGRTVARTSLLGQVQDLAQVTVAVPFNDIDAVERTLAAGDVACLITEPALTNCGLVLPRPGFIQAVQALCHRHGVVLVLDETHTLATAYGGWSRANGVAPDSLVVGKAIAGGLPCAVYGFSDEVAARMASAKQSAAPGHSGIGTTLSANWLALAALEASLTEVITPTAYERMLAAAHKLQAALERVIAGADLPWCVTRLGARMELQFCRSAPNTAAEARLAMDEAIERCLHLYLLNRGIIVTPFHDMWLVPPMTGEEDIERAEAAFGAFAAEALA